jgi:hypothetical protein
VSVVVVEDGRLRVTAGSAEALARTGAFPEEAAHAAAAVRTPLARLECRFADRRGEGRIEGWADASTAVVAAPVDEDGLQDLLVRPAPLLASALARLLGVGPRAAVGERRRVQRAGLAAAVADGELARWTAAFDRPPAPPGVVSVVDDGRSCWLVEPEADGLTLVPATPSAVWDALAACCALPAAAPPR